MVDDTMYFQSLKTGARPRINVFDKLTRMTLPILPQCYLSLLRPYRSDCSLLLLVTTLEGGLLDGPRGEDVVVEVVSLELASGDLVLEEVVELLEGESLHLWDKVEHVEDVDDGECAPDEALRGGSAGGTKSEDVRSVGSEG
jgi:hypothetical protein